MSLTACHNEHQNPLLKNIKASTKIVLSAYSAMQDDFSNIGILASSADCFSTTKEIDEKYAARATNFKAVCKKFKDRILAKAHKNPLFKTANNGDLNQVFFNAYSKESDTEFMQ